MADKPLLDDKQIETLLRAGPELDKLEPVMSPELREVLVDLQRNAANHYASGEWQVEGPKQPAKHEILSRQAPYSAYHLYDKAQNALGSAYLETAGSAKDAFKTLMNELGIGRIASRVAPTNPPYFTL